MPIKPIDGSGFMPAELLEDSFGSGGAWNPGSGFMFGAEGRLEPVPAGLFGYGTYRDPNSSDGATEVSNSPTFRTPYKVHKGDALERIAKAIYGDAQWRAGLAALMLVNHIRKNQYGSPLIYPGQTLVVPEIEDDHPDLERMGGAIIAANSAGLAELRRRQAAERAVQADIGPAVAEPPERSTWQKRLWEVIDRDPIVRQVGGDAAEWVGRGAGVVRGGWRTIQDIGNGIAFAGRLLQPGLAQIIHQRVPGSEAFIRPDYSAWHEVGDAGKAVGDYAWDRATHPEKLWDDVRRGVHQARVDLDPRATPAAATLIEELRRRGSIGANQGELGFDVLKTIYSGGLAKGFEVGGLVNVLRGAEATRKANMARWMRHGFTESQAARWSGPNDGAGHHSAISESLGRKLKLPREILDHPLNVIKPRAMTFGEAQEHHYGLHQDGKPGFYGGNLRGGGRWSGREMKFRRYSPIERIWYGTAPELRGYGILVPESLNWIDQAGQEVPNSGSQFLFATGG